MSKVHAIYHIVFSTRHRESTLPDNLLEDVYRFIWALLRERGCALYRIGGIGNHIHLLINLPANARLSDIVRDIKANTSGWLNRDERFPNFCGWNKEYFAMTVSPRHKQAVVEYISNQKQHHTGRSLDNEIIQLYGEAGFEYDPRDMND
ncbi:MAG: IS200/IS605 family transposase [Paramuribaculum sp.]|nr:IS200/IS605 family transposase [Paramuribaculum sp.]